MSINVEVILISYDWAIATTGELFGLTAGDHGYEPTGIHVLEVLEDRADLEALKRCLQWYVDNDETAEGGEWEEHNAFWLKGKREAEVLLSKWRRE